MSYIACELFLNYGSASNDVDKAFSKIPFCCLKFLFKINFADQTIWLTGISFNRDSTSTVQKLAMQRCV